MRTNSHPKTHIKHWELRVTRRAYKNTAGESIELPEYQIKLNHNNRQRYIKLGTTNKDNAAQKARKHYLYLISNGWDALNLKLSPKDKALPERINVTIGEWINAVQLHSELKDKTLLEYAKAFRQLVAEIEKIRGTKTKHDHSTGGRKAWVAKIDKVKLSAITPQRVITWRKAYIKKAGISPLKQESAKATSNKIIRNAKSLFGKKVMMAIEGYVNLPTPLPFDSIEQLKEASHSYESSLSPELLIGQAEKDLKENEPEAFKIFLLSLFCGFRRGEIDKLLWKQINFKKKQISIEITDYYRPKSIKSLRVVPIDQELVNILKAYHRNSDSEFVIQSHIDAKPEANWHHYRTTLHIKKLLAWLRIHGIDNNSPLHTLRKQFGSQINEQHGIYAASALLGHSSVQLTANHYLKNSGQASGFGAFLKKDKPKGGSKKQKVNSK